MPAKKESKKEVEPKTLKRRLLATPAVQERAEKTRAKIVKAALELFRRDGFQKATMRAIALRADVSLGAAYRYFATKESIALEYYGEQLKRQTEVVMAELPNIRRFRKRLLFVLETAIDVRKGDRTMLTALAGTVLDPDSPLGLFSESTLAFRRDSMALFEEVVKCEEVPETHRALLAKVLWIAHLAIILNLTYDESPTLESSRALAIKTSELAGAALNLLSLPIAGTLTTELTELFAASAIPIRV